MRSSVLTMVDYLAVDGTLFTDKHELHPRTRDAIRYIRKTRPELPIIPVTGKQRVSCG